ncbi:carbohydrate-binding module family 13 protein [Trichoderma evansii]
MSTFNTSMIYVLKNGYTLASKILAQTGSDGSLSMVNANNVTSDSLWFLTPTNTAQRYRLHTITNGVQRSLDVINNNGVDSTGLHLTETGNYLGQYWQFSRSPLSQHPEYEYRLTNSFTGPNKFLDVYFDTTEAFLSDGLHTGQYWQLIPANTVIVRTS